VKYLVDEQLSVFVARAWSELVKDAGDTALAVEDYGKQSMTDEEIPPFCEAEGIKTLFTLNVRDFGAKLFYYTSLIDAGVSVVVMRASKQQLDAGQQAAMVLNHQARIRKLLHAAAAPILIRVTMSEAKQRTLEELVTEVEGKVLP
jgi:hypothetical protein